MSLARNCPKNFLGKPGHATEQCLNDDDFHGYDDDVEDDGHEDDDVDRKKGCWRLVSQWLPVQCFFLTPLIRINRKNMIIRINRIKRTNMILISINTPNMTIRINSKNMILIGINKKNLTTRIKMNMNIGMCV